MQIAASILSADFSRLGEQVREAEAAGVDALHIDVMDGQFVPNITIGPLVVRAIRPLTTLPLNVHLMIERPERYIDTFAQAGADFVAVHVETCPHLHRTLWQIRQARAGATVVLNPATPLLAIDEVLDQVDLVLLMTVNPGFGGQELIPSTLGKIQKLRQKIEERGLSCRIEVDGGVNMRTLPDVVRAGANVLVMGTAIFATDKSIRCAVQRLRERLREVTGEDN
ncbi:MAG: ribulose-phosphate 3-epimerase [Chloroflexi bacterium RBG_13_56_8]|nr:MAG: ribulose-phosphate 3-epimerase [Chloroflexi bacterium RBG_13_56_8]